MPWSSDIGIDEPEAQQRLGGERGTAAAQAVEDTGRCAMGERLGGLVVDGRVAVHLELEQAARDVDRARDVALGEFLGLAHVHDRAAELLQLEQLDGLDLADPSCGRRR